MLKPLIKISFSSVFSNLFNRQKKTGKALKVLYTVLGIYIVFSAFSLAFVIFSSVINDFIKAEASWFYFSFSAIIVTILSVLGSFTIAQSLIYDSKDNELLFSMPVKISDILLSRVFVLLIFNYIYTALIQIPAGVVYSIYTDFSLIGFIAFTVLSLLFPFFTVSISIMFAWLLTLVTKKLKRKTIFSFVFALFFLLTYMYLSFNLQNVVAYLATNVSQLSAIISKYFAVFYLFGTASADGNILSFIILSLITLVIFALVIFILSSTFLNLVNRSTKQTKKSTVKINKSNSLVSLIKKEFARLTSCQTYILNTTIGGILALIFSVMILIKGEDFLSGFALFSQIDDLLPVVIATVLAFCAGMNSTTVSSVSLEGSMINIIKSLPIDYRDFYNAKIILNLLYGIPLTLIASIVACFAFDGDILDRLFVIIYPLLLQIFAAVSGLSINMHKPKFNWTNVLYPIKQSFTVLKEIIFSMILATVPLTLCILTDGMLNYQIVYLILTFLVLIADVLIYVHIMRKGEKYYEMMS